MMALKEAGMHLAVFGATFSQSPKTLPLLKEQAHHNQHMSLMRYHGV
jgi:hypothetical protein